MYSLYLSNKLQDGTIEETPIYSSNTPSETLALISPSVEVEAGASGSCDFTIPPSNIGYNLVELMRTEVIFKINDEEKWRGRVLNTDTDFYNQMKVECEGEMAYLNDTYQPQKEYDSCTLRQFLETVLTIHNNKVTDSNGNPIGPIDKRFKIGAVYVEDTESATVDEMFRKTDYDTTMSCLKSVANTYKAYFMVRWGIDNETGILTRYLDFVKKPVVTSTQTIDFGQNLLDFSKTYNMQDLCTVAMPIGAKMEDKAGDEIHLYDTENDNPINYIYHCSDQDDGRNGQFGYDSQDPYRYARVCYLNTGEFQTGDKIYVSTSQSVDNPDGTVHKDGIWCFADASGNVIEGTFKYWNGSGSEVETYEKYELTIPAGAHRFRVASYKGLQPEIKVYRQKAKERVDECYTIESVASYGGEGDESNPVKHTVGDIYIIHKALFEKYGWHEKKLTFGDLDNSQKLNDLAVEYLTTTQFEQMTLEVTAIDLSNLNANYEQIWINMNIPICSKPHGLEYGQFILPCTKIKLKLDSPEDSQYTLGYSSSEQISDTQTNVSADLSALMGEIPAISPTLQAAKDNAMQLLNAFGDAGYVTFEKHQNSNAIQAIIISNAEDPNLATQRWIWNHGGFAYQERQDATRDWSNPDVAISIDGTISANRIVSGQMYADRIRGGTLKLGVPGASPGDIQVYDGVEESLNHRMVAIEKDWGITNETPSDGTYIRIRGTTIYGGFKDHQNPGNEINVYGEPATGAIQFKQPYDNAYGVDLRGHVIGFNTSAIYVRDYLDGSANVRVGYSGQITIGNTTLDISHGFIVGYSQTQDQGE